jgi:hypothetical protein
MRRNIELYIGGQRVDLNDNSFILFNYTLEDLSNPTAVKNSFSKSITLPGTSNNNSLFGHMYRVDRITQYGGYIGADFDAMRRIPFEIFDEKNEIIESGYAKLEKVQLNGMDKEYQVALYGGLGSFFYSLMYRSDGTKKTLSDMRYLLLSGNYGLPGAFGQVGGYGMVQDAWSYLVNPDAYNYEEYDNTWCHIINFAPAYNGIPEKDFSADKAVVDNKSFNNVPYTKLIDKVSYSFKTGTDSNLMLFTNKHSEWEMRDLRWYLQRPVFRVKGIFDAAADPENNGGYEVVISDSIKEMEFFKNGWITLPMIPLDQTTNQGVLQTLLTSTLSPADYIISFAKIFGLVFTKSIGDKKILIRTRSEYYRRNTNPIDLTNRVNVSSISITPTLSQERFYQYGQNAIGEWALNYKSEQGRDYGIQVVNTGNEFNTEKKVVTADIIYKDAVEVQERSLLFTSNVIDRSETTGAYGGENFILPLYESVKLQLWGIKEGDTEQTLQEIDIALLYENFRFFFNPDYPLSDWLPKVQFHEAENKAIDGSNVLLVFDGVKDAPVWEAWARLEYRLTDDIPDMMTLNNAPCWNYTQQNSRILQRLPSFRRNKVTLVDGDEEITASLEWGIPLARGVNGSFHNSQDPKTIYNLYWSKYQKDRFDDDTIILKCKVDLRGLQVEQDLLGRFFYYQGAIFVLNKITNYSLSTYDDTECEFIRVQNINNYIE